MMFVDFLALLLVNMVAGFVLLAVYVFKGLDDQEQRHWAPGLAICGGIALVFGAYITACWPLPGSYNVAYGEMSVLFGAIFLATAVAMLAGWQLTSVAGYAFFAGLAAVVVGVRILNLGLTQAPLLAGAGFLLSGIAGMGAFPVLLWFRSNIVVRALSALVLLATAGVWALTGYGAYWMHISGFMKYMPGH